MRNVDWALGGAAAVLLAGVGASLVTMVSMTWTPDLARMTATYGLDEDGEGAADAGPGTEGPTSAVVEEQAPPVAHLVQDEVAPEAGLLVHLSEPQQGVASELASKVAASQTESLGGLSGGSPEGLIGREGQAYGVGGLGTRGSGYGGGGSAHGFGRGSGLVGAGTKAPGANAGLSRSELGPGVVGISQHSAHSGPINGFIQAGRDRLSTFAIDVDTGSYTLSRSLLRRGQLPSPQQVRVEEFVNAMDYELAPPTSGSVPFAVAAEAAPHPTSAKHALLRVALKGEVPEVGSRANRLTFLVDTSCSMTEELGLVKTSLHTLVDHAGAEDSIAIATYAGSTSVVLEPTPTTRRAAIHAAIDGLSNGGGTAMNSGMELAYTMADKAYVAGAENRVVVLSDGDANIGPSSHEQILANIKTYAGKGITMSAVGFGGANYRDGMMEQLADNGDGNYVYIDSPREAQRVFGEGLSATLTTIARDVKVQLAFDTDAVLAWRLIGYENRDVADKDFRNDAVDGGEIGAGHEVTALYEVVLADELPASIGHVYLRAKPPGPDAPAREWTVPIRRTQLRSEWGDASHDLRLAASAALFAEKLRGSPFVEELGWEEITRLLHPLPATKDVLELRELVRTAERLSGGEPILIQAGVAAPNLGDPSAVSMEVVRRHMPQLRYCYQRQLVQDRNLKGSVELQLTIDAAGNVSSAGMPGGTLKDGRVKVCLMGRVRRMHFPAHSPHELRFTLDFAP